jgi:hypothetical protein
MLVEFDAGGDASIDVTLKPYWKMHLDISIANSDGTVTITLDEDKARELARSILEQLGEEE